MAGWLDYCIEPWVPKFVEKLEWVLKLMLFMEEGEKLKVKSKQQVERDL